MARQQAPASPAQDAAADQRPRILVIDDSPLVLDMLEEALAKHWQIRTASSGEDALRMAGAFRPDVVVCDLYMPEMDGKEVHRQLSLADPTVAFIVLSGEADLAVVLGLVREGVFDYVPKNDGTEALVAAADRAIRHVRVVRENLRLSEDLRAINRELEQRLDELEASREVHAAKERLERELEIAGTIQTSLVPRRVPVRNFDFAGTLVPASVVGGDYYDVTPTAEGLWLGIGDVSGHGLEAGLIMLMVQSGLGALLRARPGLRPSEAVAAINELLVENVRHRMGKDDHVTLTVLHCSVDGTVRFAGAHEDLLVWRAESGKCEVVHTPGTWVGIQSGLDFPDDLLHLEPGDTLLLYTDGVTEAHNARSEMVGLMRLGEWFEGEANHPVEAVRDRLIERVRGWQTEQRDDMTVVVVRYLGRAEPGGEPVSLAPEATSD
jgi:serine phosphatase RsbU (regulator of sigma subunit)